MLSNPPIFPQVQIHTKTHSHKCTNVNSTENTFPPKWSEIPNTSSQYHHCILNLKHFLVPLQVGVYEHFLRPYNEIFICTYTSGMALLQMSSLVCRD
jgi:hypothetical protein